MKRFLAVILLLAGLAIAYHLIRGPGSISETRSNTEFSPSPADKKNITPNARGTADVGETPGVMVPVEKKSIPAEHGRVIHYRVIGNGGYPAKIIDGSGNVLLEATPDFSIHAVSEAPDGTHLLVKSYPMGLIIDTVSNKKMALPTRPPGENKLGFGSWDWIDDDTILGVSGDRVSERKPGVEGESNNVAQTRLYLYELTDGLLKEVKLDGISAKVFSITEVRRDGYVHLVQDDANEERDLGWFQVGAK